MATEGATLIEGLNPASPTGQGAISDGDEEFNQLKFVLQNQFPNMGNAQVTASATELSRVAGVTSPIQSQLDDQNLVQGYGGFNSGQSGVNFEVPFGGQWKTFVQAGAASYYDGIVATSNPATGIIQLISGTPSWVRLHAVLTLMLKTNAASSFGQAMRCKFIRNSDSGEPNGSSLVSAVPLDEDLIVTLVVDAIDTGMAASGENYRLQLNQDGSSNLSFEIRTMNIWAEVIGRN